MATLSIEIDETKGDINFLRVLLQSLDESGVDRDANRSKRIKILTDIERLEEKLRQLEQRRLEERSASRQPSSPYPLSFNRGSPVPPHAISGGSPNLPPCGSALSPASHPIQPDNELPLMPSQVSGNRHKRYARDADLSDAVEPSSKRPMASFGNLPASSSTFAGSSRRPSDASDIDDDLWRVLGLDSKDSFREFQEEQKKAEQWLKNRKEEERRDAECARRLQDNLLASPHPSPAQSSSTRYSGSNIFSGLGSPVRGPEPISPSRFPGLPSIGSLKPHEDDFPRLPAVPSKIMRHPPIPSFPGPGDSDVEEIAPADFRRIHQYPPYSLPSLSNRAISPTRKDLSTSKPYTGISDLSGLQGTDYTASLYPPWALAGPAGARAGPLYGPSVLQNTLARLDAAREPFGRYPRPGGAWPPTSFFHDFMDDFEQPLGYMSEPFDLDPKKTSEEIKQLLETIRPDSDISQENREGTPDALKYPLMEHQKLGLSWMKTMEECEKKGGILADDMGLGKTIQALALMVSRPSTDPERNPTLVVAPVSLMQQWKREIQRMLRPGKYQMSVYILHGEKGKRSFTDLKDYDVVLTTYGTVAAEFRRKESYEEREEEQGIAVDFTIRKNELPILGPISKWHRVILDEAQCIKNRNTKSAQAACQIDATYRWCMSGTPMMNNVGELHSLLKFLRIRPYCVLEKFSTEFTRPLKYPGSHDYGRAMEKLRVLLKAVLLRRTKTSKIDGRPILQLPPRVTEKVHAVFDEDEQEFYKALETRTQIQFNKYLSAGTVGRNYSSILVLLLRLRQACCHPHLIKDFSFDVNANTNELDLVANAKAFGPQVIARLKDSEDMECPICIDAVDNPIIFFPCGHSTCAECFSRISDPELSVRQGIDGGLIVKCPNCRGQVDPKKITDHATFKKVHYPNPSDTEPEEQEEPKAADDAENESEDESDDDSLSNFVVDDENKDRSSTREKGKGKMPKKPKKTLAELKKEGSRNKKAKRKYLRRLEKTFISSAKIDKTMEILQRIQDEGNGEKTIVFSQFTSLLDLLEIPINRKDWVYRRYDGSMKPVDRNNAVIEFTDNPNCKIMLVSLKAGNSGLNLVAASQVIVFDPFWNPYVEDQAVDRAHRIGQLREVRVHRILVQNTVEDRILELQEKKRELVEGALDEKAGKNLARLGIRELGYLFGINNINN